MIEPGKYRKRPIEIEAIRFVDPESAESIVRWAGEDRISPEFPEEGGPMPALLHVQTLEGIMRCRPGDWVIKGVAGEFYPCAADIFRATYEGQG